MSSIYAKKCYEKGEQYYYGKDVAQSFKDAVKWYREAAEMGHPDAQFKLGACYEKEKGVAKNLAEAVKWYRKAAKQGDEYAQKALTDRGLTW